MLGCHWTVLSDRQTPALHPLLWGNGATATPRTTNWSWPFRQDIWKKRSGVSRSCIAGGCGIPSASRELKGIWIRFCPWPIPPLEEKIETIRSAVPNGVVAGLTGVIASGKSTVSSKLADLGARLIDFDLIAHQVVEPGKPAYNDVVKFFGTQVCRKDGTLDRKKISDIVFKDMEKRKKAGAVHPSENLRGIF